MMCGGPRRAPPSAPDVDILTVAQTQQRALVTFGKDFGELVFRRGRSASHGIALFRVTTRDPDHAALVVVRELEAHAQRLEGHFIVVDDWRARVVPLPPSPES